MKRLLLGATVIAGLILLGLALMTHIEVVPTELNFPFVPPGRQPVWQRPTLPYFLQGIIVFLAGMTTLGITLCHYLEDNNIAKQA